MALTLGDNFSYQGAKPLDARLKYDTVAAMKAVADATMYEGCLAYCSGTDKTYQWKSGNTVDETLGKWREFSSGGGGGGETYTAGDGIDISGENVISTEKSQNGWMDEVIEKVPMSGALVNIANAFNRSDLYSETERMIGQWIDGKPLYSKSIKFTQMEICKTASWTNICETGLTNAILKKCEFFRWSDSQYRFATGFFRIENGILQYYGNPAINNVDVNMVTLYYTKTTDSAIAIGSETEYSTDEKIVGSWIDGKPLYQKTYQLTFGSIVDKTSTTVSEDISSLNTEFCKVADAQFIDGDNGCAPISTWYSSGNFYFLRAFISNEGTKLLKISTNRDYFSNKPVFVTIQYTKTT